ncbi:spore germination protein [Bacillus atrophaeus]|uniref:spore germination protein n=1 Tax=Bacillus atrophaeus TaxID=1452 RepID=UPI001EFBB56F|nr:spore germination protein [Bacillus atrophaeus]MCG8398672.1 spore germination protein [Bacillus atrophaeus]
MKKSSTNILLIFISRTSLLNCIKAISSSEKNELCDIIDAILSGSVVYFSELSEQAKLFTAGQNPLRSITEPESESIVRGAHDGFVESLDTNISGS